MSAIQTVAIAGASGAIGTAVLTALLKANFTVTVLTRADSATTPSFPASVKVTSVDYTYPASLHSALTGQHALISTVGYAGILSQLPLIDAAVAAGVRRVLPSEYGSDPSNAAARALPVFAHKVQVEQHLKAVAAKSNGRTTWTLVCNNEFFDWDLDHSFGVDIPARGMEIFDGGDAPFTATPLSFVAEGVVGVLKRPEETADRIVRLHGASVTQNRLLEMLKRCTSAEGWEVKQSSTVEREREGYERLTQAPTEFVPWMMAFLQCAVWGSRFGNDFSRENDNALVGLEELSEEEIERIVRVRC